MPPKPWLTKTGPPRQDVSAIIQSNPTIKQQIPKLSMDQMMGPQNAQNSLGANMQNSVNGNTNGIGINNGLGTTAGLGGTGTLGAGYGGTGYGTSYGGMGSSYGGGYGSSYGGYGGSSYGGGYGSSYGMGGYGSSYGMGGMGGMGGYGRMGMMSGGDPNQKGIIMNTLITLQSFGFLISNCCQIGRSLDQNMQGLSIFQNSFLNLFKKIYNGIKSGGSWLGQKTRSILMSILNFIKTYILFMNHQDPKNRMKSLKLIINISVFVLVITLYPQVKKLLNKVG